MADGLVVGCRLIGDVPGRIHAMETGLTLHGREPRERALVESLAPEALAISIISYPEGCQGTPRSPVPKRVQEQCDRFLPEIPVSPRSMTSRA